MREQQRQQQFEEASSKGADIALIGAAVSVLLSWYVFFGRGDRDLGLFVGLWPPTILAFAGYLKHIETNEMLQRHMRSSTRQSVRETVEGLVGTS